MNKELLIQRRIISNSSRLVAITSLLGIMYPILAKEIDDPIALLNGLLIGSIGGIFISANEFQWFGSTQKRSTFMQIITKKSLIYTLFFSLLVPIIIGLSRSREAGIRFIDYLGSESMKDFVLHGDYLIIILYILFLSATITFTISSSRKIGFKVFWNFITGKYFTPREEERIFMFMDVNSSTTIAEKLGELRYHEFLNDFFYDVTPSILITKGEIYRYVGDEVVVSWKMNVGLKEANCIRTFWFAQQAIEKQKEKYYEKYGFAPGFSAAFHAGKIMCGEIGDVKSQIVFLGDVMYTGAQVEKQCRKLKQPFLITSSFIDQLPIPVIFEKEHVGELSPSHQAKPLQLYTLKERNVVSM